MSALPLVFNSLPPPPYCLSLSRIPHRDLGAWNRAGLGHEMLSIRYRRSGSRNIECGVFILWDFRQ